MILKFLNIRGANFLLKKLKHFLSKNIVGSEQRKTSIKVISQAVGHLALCKKIGAKDAFASQLADLRFADSHQAK